MSAIIDLKFGYKYVRLSAEDALKVMSILHDGGTAFQTDWNGQEYLAVQINMDEVLETGDTDIYANEEDAENKRPIITREEADSQREAYEARLEQKEGEDDAATADANS